MKKLFYAFTAVALTVAIASCNKKCGHCEYSDGRANSEATCDQTLLSTAGVSLVKEAKADCQADTAGTWVETD